MAANIFIDTNILIYSVDRADPGKQNIAIATIAHHATNRSGVISTQVLQEFYSAATRKLGISPIIAKKHIQDFQIFDVVQLSASIIEQGIDISIFHKISFWDGLIIASASNASASELLSEDLNHGQNIEGISIINPFHTPS
jgi:predicted nucleic acid-binding protein